MEDECENTEGTDYCRLGFERGAGIQADLKTFSALGVYALCAVTALTAQNTLGVNGIVEIDPDFVSSQIRSVVLDMGVDAVKTGMLCNGAIISRVAADVESLRINNLIVDPVMISTSGHRLLDENAMETLVSRLFPLALVVTPNLHEAGLLTGTSVESEEDMRRAAVELWRLGCRYVVIKGGASPGRANRLALRRQKFSRVSRYAPWDDPHSRHRLHFRFGHSGVHCARIFGRRRGERGKNLRGGGNCARTASRARLWARPSLS